MPRVLHDLRYLFDRLRLASQRFWAAAAILGLGLISSSFLIWMHSEATHHTSSHLPLIIQTDRLSLAIAQSHLLLEEYLSGDLSIDSWFAFDALYETLSLADSVEMTVLRDKDLLACPRHEQYLSEIKQVKIILGEFVATAHERVENPNRHGPGSGLDAVSDSQYRNLLTGIESMREVLLYEIGQKKAELSRVLWTVILVWLGLLLLVFTVTKNKAQNRERVLQTLREAEKKVRLFIATAGDMIYFQRPDGSLRECNQAVSRITGYSVKEFEKNPLLWWNILHPDDRAEAEKLLHISPHRKSSIDVQYRLKTKNGRWRWIQSRKVPVQDQNSNFAGYNCIDRDITRQRQNAEALAAKTRELSERAKEQNCLYRAGKVIRDDSISLEQTLYEILDLIEASWQHPEIAQACITFRGKTYAKADFTPTLWKQSADIVVSGETVGAVEVYYIEERPAEFEGPFLKEERDLLNALATEISVNLERHKAEREIKRHNLFLNSVLDSLTYPFYVLDATDYTIKMANKASGVDISSGPATCYRLTHGEDVPCSEEDHPCPIERVKRTRSHCVVEHIHRDCHGIQRYHEVHGYPLFDDDGNVVQIIEYMFDITERKLTESKLNELAAFPANNPNVVMSINGDGEVLYMNAATAESLRAMGISPKEAHLSLPENVKQIIEQCHATRSGMLNVLREISGRTWTWSFHPVDGRDIVHCYATDITDLIRQEKEVRKLSAAVEQSSTMVCITDTDGKVEYVNPFFTKVTGYALEEVAGKPISILKSGEQGREFYAEMWRTIKSGQSWTGNVRNRRRDGEPYWERKTITPIQNDRGEIVSFLSVGNDITYELKTQQKLIQTDKLSAIGTLAAGVAHEFKNYLAGIIGNASFTLEQLDRSDGLDMAAEAFHKIIEMGEKANDVAVSLLSYSRARPEDTQMEDLRTLIEKSVKLVEKEMRNQSIELVTHFDEVPPVKVSASKIQQLLLNLLINAQQAIRSKGIVTVGLFARDDNVEIKVADTGAGIPRENIERIFDPFFSTKGVWGEDEVSGTGIGLSVCRNIAREFGGELTVESVVGVGSAFTLTLPVSQSDKLSTPLARQTGKAMRAAVFSLDTSLIKQFYEDACRFNAQLLAIDDVTNVPDDLSAVADVVILDSKFTGKLELLRMVDRCRAQNIPYVMVNCGASPDELGDLYKYSRANYKDLPLFAAIYSLFDAIGPNGERAETSERPSSVQI